MYKLCSKSLSIIIITCMILCTLFACNVSAHEVEVDETGISVPSFSKIEIIDGGIRFNWSKFVNSNYPNGVFYRIYYKNYRGDWVRMITTAATQYVDTDVHIGKTFQYTIRCVAPDGSAFASGFNANGWTVTYYDAPVVTSVTPSISLIASTANDNAAEEPETVEPTEGSIKTPSATEPETIKETETTVSTSSENEAFDVTETESIEETMAQTEAETESNKNSSPN